MHGPVNVKFRYFCPTFTKFGVSQQIFLKVPSIKLHENPSSGSRVDADGHTDRADRRTDMKKLIGVFRQHAKAPEKEDTKRNKNETG
jgi:hypothetical protein